MLKSVHRCLTSIIRRTQSGKFYTPECVIRLFLKVIQSKNQPTGCCPTSVLG